ncbi:MAG: dihydrofolate reductase [Bacteroidetes bacterium GWC2_33_15]|nr:MAG: dihydrofolate reductase [Bacteroidetes bacterium GWA2_33_15]OFX48825.1 MAG: dihydrofolate reductase [Bacteroidetes bacterium GWC2_33_15]OFX66068.1 MAG: dihydrofolate reductase [Bacteroidetes bacterium GWB2_32_14]OFX68170.1 MAG: dihydrofolate reductase [Bacteroidetes bacterium GWD2_33_33]HAN17944.1 dihydrofolate reductase [Bacteroidales bacterium]
MRNLVYFMHSSLDGFVAGSNGEMDWITVDDEIFDFVTTMTDQVDTALYGRVTYQMMEAYWPTAGEQPNASRHDKEHSIWYKNVSKVVLSKTINETGLLNTKVISDNLSENINKLKQQSGKNILIFGSPRASHSLLNLGLVDEFWIFINPILLGQGIPLFKNVQELIKLRLLDTKTFTSGVVALHYRKE